MLRAGRRARGLPPVPPLALSLAPPLAPQLALSLLLSLAPLPAPATAQNAPPNAPMSAIDWLSNSVATPARPPISPPTPPDEPGVSSGAGVEEVSVTPLGRPLPDAVGLLPAVVTGLPADLWGPARPSDVAGAIRRAATDMLPAPRDLLYTLLLAELNPPEGTGSGSGSASGHDIFLARVDKLLEMGAVEQADALLARAGPEDPEIFRRWFDTSLLLGTENQLCEVMRATPSLSPTFTARAFCLARGGDWNAAVLTLGTGRALGFISPEEDALLARFLDPELFEGAAPLPVPAHPTPLEFRLFEAIGQPIPTRGLPLAFAQADLRANIGWKARIEAAERLARSGAVSENLLLGLYTERRAAASGGVWERVAAVQAVDRALREQDREGLAAILPEAWRQMQESALEVPFARLFGPALSRRALPGEAGRIALTLGLLSDDYEEVAMAAEPGAGLDLARALARGLTEGASAATPGERALLAGFRATRPPARLATLVESGRLGEALLRALALFSSGALGNHDELADALALFRVLGLEDIARRSALEYLLLERRG